MYPNAEQATWKREANGDQNPSTEKQQPQTLNKKNTSHINPETVYKS